MELEQIKLELLPQEIIDRILIYTDNLYTVKLFRNNYVLGYLIKQKKLNLDKIIIKKYYSLIKDAYNLGFTEFSCFNIIQLLQESRLDIIKFLYNQNNEIFKLFNSDYTLHYACKLDLETVKFFYDIIPEKFCNECISIAVQSGKLDIVKFLIENSIKYHNTLMTWACINDRLDIVKYFQSLGFEIDDQSKKFALNNKNKSIIDFLHLQT